MLQCVAVCCSVLQCVTVCYSVLQCAHVTRKGDGYRGGEIYATHCNTLQHTATHCNTLQHAATHCNGGGVTYAFAISHMNESCHTHE